MEFNPSGGLFQFAVQLGGAMAAAGHEVELVTGRRPEFAPGASGLRVATVLPTWHPGAEAVEPTALRRLRRPLRALRYLAAWARLARHLARTRPDVVQWSEWRFAIDGWLVAWLARRRRAPAMALVAHTPRPLAEHRDRGSLYRSGRLLRAALGAAYRRMDVVFVLGERSRRELLDAWPGLSRVEVLPHGDQSVFLRGPVAPVESTPPRALFFGDWGRHKGLDVLLDAAAGIRDTVPDAELVVAGAVRDDTDLGLVERLAARAGNVRLAPGYVPAGEVAALLEGCRLVVTPYRIANQSGVVQLAHTFSRPVVASDVGDLPEAVRHGDTGLLVAPGDAAALAAAMVRLLSDPGEAARLGRNGRERLRRESSWAAVATTVLRVYAGIAAGRAGPGRPVGRGGGR